MAENLQPKSAAVRLLSQGGTLALEARAATLPQLFDIVALGLFALLRLPLPDHGQAVWPETLRLALAGQGFVTPPRQLAASGHDTGALLVHWLRELMFLHETAGFVYVSAHFFELGPQLSTEVAGVCSVARSRRELRGVTYHDLMVSPVGDAWLARLTCAV